MNIQVFVAESYHDSYKSSCALFNFIMRIHFLATIHIILFNKFYIFIYPIF